MRAIARVDPSLMHARTNGGCGLRYGAGRSAGNDTSQNRPLWRTGSPDHDFTSSDSASASRSMPSSIATPKPRYS